MKARRHASGQYIVTAVSIDADGAVIVNEFTDERGRRDELIDVSTNDIFRGCRGPWAVEDRYEAYWNRLNPAWEHHFPAGKNRVKVVSIRSMDDLQADDQARLLGRVQ